MPSIDFYFDYTSPYSYLASTQVDALAERTGVDLTWQPALLGGLFKATGNVPPQIVPARGSYMMADLVRWATHYGVPFRFSPHHPTNTIAALRAALAIRAHAPAAFSKFNHLAFRAVWAEGRDLGNRAVIGEVAEAAGADGARAVAANDDPELKALLKAQTERAAEAGAFGMPFFLLHDGAVREAYFGNDRLPLLEARLRRGVPWIETET